MAKANLSLTDGTKVTIEGAAEEVAIILSKCSPTGVPPSGGETPKRVPLRQRAGRSKGNGPAKKKSGPTLYITELVDEQYFKSKKRTLGDIQKKLEERGHIYAQTSLSPILTRLTRKRTLRRIKETKGWVYVS